MQYIVMHQALDEPSSCMSSACDVTPFRRLHVPCGSHPLEGLWRGTYGGHGLEIISLQMQPDGCTLRGRKVTGDPNVPHSQVGGLRPPVPCLPPMLACSGCCMQRRRQPSAVCVCC